MINNFEDGDFNQLQHRQHSELVLVQKNPLYDDNDNDDFSDQQRVQQKFNGPNTKVVSNEDEPTVQAFSFEFNEENISMVQQHAGNEIPIISKQQLHNNLSKTIIITWEEIINNKHRT